MRDPPLVLVVDDSAFNRAIIRDCLERQGYAVAVAEDGVAALAGIHELRPDLVLMDVMMPGLDGIEVVRRVKADALLAFVPIILVTSRDDLQDVVAGLDAGAHDYLSKSADHAALLARVRSMLRIKSLHDMVEAQRAELRTLNAELERRVAEQVAELERVGRLRRFLPPKLADIIVASGDETFFDHHRREIVVLFCDLRGFTAFAETAEPEDVMAVLRTYHVTLGPLIHRHEATLMRFLGDGLMVFFNDPIPCPDPALRAVRLAAAMREAMEALQAGWRRSGHDIGFGVGIAQGYATLGRVGFQDYSEYTAMGTVMNLAARLCEAAANGQILISQRVAAAVEAEVRLEEVGGLALKGLTRPGAVFQVVG